MADFNVNLQAPTASGARPLQPVSDNRTPMGNPWIPLAANLASIFVKNKEDQAKQEKEAQEQAIVNEFTRQQTALSDAIAQGTPISQANARARANFSKYSAQYPHLVENFAKTNKQLFEYTDLGEAKDQTQMFKDARKNLINDAVKAGYMIDDTMPVTVVDASINSFQKTRAAEAEFERLEKRRAAARSASSEERAAFEFKARQESTQLLATIGDAHLDSTFQTAQAIVAEGRRTGDMETANAKITQLFSTVDRSLLAAAGINPSLAKPYQDLFAELRKFSTDSMSGKTTEDELKALQNRIMLTTLASPENKALYGMSKVFNGPLPATFLNAQTAARDSFVRLTQEFGGNAPVIVGKKDLEGPAYDMIKAQVGAIEAGKASDPEATKTALGNAANNVLKQIGASAGAGVKPEALSAAFNFIASPEYAKLVSYGKIDKEAAESAKKLFSLMYERDVSKAIEAKMGETFDRTIKREQQETYGQLVDFKWGAAGVVAEKTDMGTGKAWLNRQEMEARDAFVRNMGSSTKALNQLIKAGAHMEGHTDYQKYWEENKHNILPGYFPDPNKLKPGQVVDGYKYLGGNVKAQSNWVKEPTEVKK